MTRIGYIGSSLMAAAAAAAALASVASIAGPEPVYPHRREAHKPKKKQKAKKPRTAKVLLSSRDEFRANLKADERAKAEAAIPDKYLHSAERRRRQAAREGGSI